MQYERMPTHKELVDRFTGVPIWVRNPLIIWRARLRLCRRRLAYVFTENSFYRHSGIKTKLQYVIGGSPYVEKVRLRGAK
jgi:hypothetical protein